MKVKEQWINTWKLDRPYNWISPAEEIYTFKDYVFRDGVVMTPLGMVNVGYSKIDKLITFEVIINSRVYQKYIEYYGDGPSMRGLCTMAHRFIKNMVKGEE